MSRNFKRNSILIGVFITVLICTTAFIFSTFTIEAQGQETQNTDNNTHKIKVACIGDSITYGTQITNREQNSYPVKLQNKLGNKYDVQNFGASGFCLQKSADRPYWQHKYFATSASFRPDIVVIMLGTNDTKAMNWKNTYTFVKDYKSLINYYRSLPSNPKIYITTTPTIFADQSKSSFISTNNNKVCEAIKISGLYEDVTLIDINALTANKKDVFQKDGVHINEKGAELISQEIFKVIDKTYQ